MKMNMSKKERDMLIGLFGILIAVAVWFFYASPKMNENEVLRTENAELKAKVEEYQAIHARVSEYSNGILDLDSDTDELVSHFPAMIKAEDAVMFWSNVDKAYPKELYVRDLEIGERHIVSVEGATVAEDGSVPEIAYNEDGEIIIPSDITSQYMLYGMPEKMNVVCSYQGMKDLFKFINKQYNKNSINSFEIYYDSETGLLSGNIEVELYYVTGQDENDKDSMFIPNVPSGQSDVFHTGSVSSEALEEIAEALEEIGEAVVDNTIKDVDNTNNVEDVDSILYAEQAELFGQIQN